MIQSLLRWVTPTRPPRLRPRKQVAIVVPMSDRPALTADEQVSLRHLQRHLSRYDRFLLLPDGSPFHLEGFIHLHFPRKFFGSAVAHNHLTYSPGFYKKFRDYRYVFFYHLDSLVFSDQLQDWCARGLDYIGAPWIVCSDTPWITRPRVGNGGFTLLSVRGALEALYGRYRKEPSAYWLDLFTRNHRRMEPVARWLKALQPHFPRTKLIKRPLEEWERMRNPAPHKRNNDVFWSDKAVRYAPDFKVASLEEGLQFAFEASPRTCLAMNGGKMPFGCHAWSRYDRGFWEPHLLPSDDEVEQPAPAVQAADAP